MPRLVRRGGLALAGIGVVALAGYLLIPLAARTFVRAVAWLATGSVRVATSLSSGSSLWTIGGSVWSGTTAALVTPTASAALWVLVLIAVLALYGLQRLLDSDEE